MACQRDLSGHNEAAWTHVCQRGLFGIAPRLLALLRGLEEANGLVRGLVGLVKRMVDGRVDLVVGL